MTKTGRQSTRHHEMHTEEHALKKETPIYDFFPVGESRLYWYKTVINVFFIRKYTVSFTGDVLLSYKPWDEISIMT